MKEGWGAPGVPLTAVIGHWQCGEALAQDTHTHLMASLSMWLQAKSAKRRFQSQGVPARRPRQTQPYRTIKERQALQVHSPTFQNTAAARPPQMSASPFHTPLPLIFFSPPDRFRSNMWKPSSVSSR